MTVLESVKFKTPQMLLLSFNVFTSCFHQFFPHKYVNVKNLSFQLVSLIIACTLPHHSVTRVVSVLFFLLLLTQFFPFPFFSWAKQSKAEHSRVLASLIRQTNNQEYHQTCSNKSMCVLQYLCREVKKHVLHLWIKPHIVTSFEWKRTVSVQYSTSPESTLLALLTTSTSFTQRVLRLIVSSKLLTVSYKHIIFRQPCLGDI